MRYKKNHLIIIVFIILNIIANATFSQKIKGTVTMVSTKNGKELKEPLINASVYWAGTTQGTVTNKEGYFEITKTELKNPLLVASFIGCRSDTIKIEDQKEVNFILTDNAMLNEIVVQEHVGGSVISTINPIQTVTINAAGLQKLACCNLSESFQNSATVDVGYSDAVSGAKQIQMLGLSGIYSQIMTENIPSIRGLSSSYGLSFIPGSWMESIQISKGTSSVKNGFESLTGQINVELKKPEESDPLFVNLYGSSEGRMEANLVSAVKLSDKWYTGLLAHASIFNNKMDENNDGFLDMPMTKQYNIANRWAFEGTKMHSVIMLNYLEEKREGGQTEYYKKDANSGGFYGTKINNHRFQVTAKNGFMLHGPESSIGLQLSMTIHDQNSLFGLRNYSGSQNSLYANLLYDGMIKNTNHKISTGLSYMMDKYDENLSDSIYKRNQDNLIPGAFLQYTYSYLDKFNIILGFRTDYTNNDGTFYTPRIHLRYQPVESFIIRASAGKGYRMANVIAENIGILASSRNIIVQPGIKAEEAWNYGLNLTKEFHLKDKKKATFTIDYYRTNFINQVIPDFDKNVHEVNFYNLNGTSYSNSFQAELNVELIKRLDFTAAYRLNDVKMTINNQLLDRPYVSKFKGLLSISYATRFEKWKFDLTCQFNGKSRLPNAESNPQEFRQSGYSPEYIMMFAQITRKFKYVDIYLGSENAGNYMQMNPIIDYQHPFSANFDASMIWGPLTGRMFYAGLRLTIK